MHDTDHPRRRRPAHPLPVERFNQPVIVQVNVCTKDRRPVLACEGAHSLCRDVWSTADVWRVGQYVIMPDHVHLFCVPGRVPMPSLERWVEFWKSRIAARWPGGAGSVPTGIAEPLKLWQRDFWDTQMRSRQQYEEKLAYVRLNPVRKELVAMPEEWPYRGEIFPLVWM